MNYLQATQVAERALLIGELPKNDVIEGIIPRKDLIEVRTRAKNQRNPNQFYVHLLTKDGLNINKNKKSAMWLKDGQFGAYLGDKINIHSNDSADLALVIAEFGNGHKYVLKSHEVTDWKMSNAYTVDLR